MTVPSSFTLVLPTLYGEGGVRSKTFAGLVNYLAPLMTFMVVVTLFITFAMIASLLPTYPASTKEDASYPVAVEHRKSATKPERIMAGPTLLGGSFFLRTCFLCKGPFPYEIIRFLPFYP